jgi:predicted transposase/invertase (TIGR01784 family)
MLENKEYNSQHKSHKLKPFSELTFTDDYMFRKVLYNNQELCKELIELLLDVDIEHIEYIDNEHLIKPTAEVRGVRLDVYVNDEDNTVFDLEMQNLQKLDLPRRTRYYQSSIDVDHLQSGTKYSELPDSYIVFICMFDPYERGMPKYEFRELCVQDPNIELGSGTSKVFVNAKSAEPNMSADMKAFLDYLCGRGATSELTRKIDADIINVKANKPWEAEYMHWNEMIEWEKNIAREEGREEGLAERREERGYDAVDSLVSSVMADAETACSVLKVDFDAYKKHKAAARTDQ